MRWHFADDPPATGRKNMDRDLALLDQISGGVEEAVLRLYEWQPYCISLGKNQSIARIREDLCRNEGIDVVTRPTGGRAVLHAEELTYCVVTAETGLGDLDGVYRKISEALVRGLKSIGVPAEMKYVGDDLRRHYGTTAGMSCFSSTTEYEIQVNGRKLVGSAQRRIHGKILQHGSILTGPYHRRLVEFLEVPSARAEELRRTLVEKTTDISEYGSISLTDLRQALKESFAVTDLREREAMFESRN